MFHGIESTLNNNNNLCDNNKSLVNNVIQSAVVTEVGSGGCLLNINQVINKKLQNVV